MSLKREASVANSIELFSIFPQKIDKIGNTAKGNFHLIFMEMFGIERASCANTKKKH